MLAQACFTRPKPQCRPSNRPQFSSVNIQLVVDYNRGVINSITKSTIVLGNSQRHHQREQENEEKSMAGMHDGGEKQYIR